MAQVVDSAKFDFLTDLKDLNALIEKLKKVAISTNELGEATKYLNTLNVAFAKEQRALAAAISVTTAENNKATSAIKAKTAEIEKSTAAINRETAVVNQLTKEEQNATAVINKKSAAITQKTKEVNLSKAAIEKESAIINQMTKEQRLATEVINTATASVKKKVQETNLDTATLKTNGVAMDNKIKQEKLHGEALKNSILEINKKTAATKLDINEINKSTAATKDETAELTKQERATKAATAEIQRKRAELKLQHEQLSKNTIGMGQFRGTVDLLKTSMGGLAAALGISAMSDFVGQVFKAQSQIQAFKLSLDSLLVNKSQSSGLFNEVREFVKESPFEFENTVTNVQKLVSSFKSVGMSAKEIREQTIPVLTSLGNSASALGLGDEGLKRLIYAFTQVQAAGKLMGTEVRQVAETGIPLLSLLSEQTGIKMSQMSKAISNGEISFKEFEKAILSAGNAGGIFAGLMDIQAQTVSGRISNLKDTIFYAMGTIGESFQGAAKGFLSFVTRTVEGLAGTNSALQRTMDVVKNLLMLFGSYKVAVMGISAVEKISNAIRLEKIRLAELDIAATTGTTGATVRGAVATEASTVATAANTAATTANISTKRALGSMISNLSSSLLKSGGAMVLVTGIIYGVSKAIESMLDANKRAEMSSTRLVIANDAEINSLVTKKVVLNQNAKSLNELTEGSTRYKAKAEQIIRMFPKYFTGMNSATMTQIEFNNAVRNANDLLRLNIGLMAKQAQRDFWEKDLERITQIAAKASTLKGAGNIDFFDKKQGTDFLRTMSTWQKISNDFSSPFTGMPMIQTIRKLPEEYEKSSKELNKAEERLFNQNVLIINKRKQEADKTILKTYNASKKTADDLAAFNDQAKANARVSINAYNKLIGKEIEGQKELNDANFEGLKQSGAKQAKVHKEIISELEKSLRAEANLLEFSEESFVNSYDIKYKLYLADLENARNNIKDKEKLKAKEIEIEEKFTQEVQKLGKAESERLQKEREKFNDDVLKQIKDFGDERIALQKSIDKKLEDAEKEALDISRKNMLIDLDIDKLNRIAMAKNNDEIIKIENEHREKLRTLRIRFEAEDIASLQKSLDAKKAYTDNLKYEYWDKLQKDQRYSEEQRLDLMTAFTDKMDKEFEDYAINNALQQQKLTNNIVEINKEGYKQQADDAAKGRQKLIDDINDANKEIEKVLGKRKEMVIQSLRFFTNNTVRSLENFLEFYENTENKVSQINAKMIKGIIKQGQDFSRSLKDINLVRIKDLDKTIELAEKNLDNLKKVINKKTEDQTEEEKGLIAKGMDSIKDLKTKKFVEQIAAAGAAAQALLQITNTFLTARREKEIAAAEEEIERLRTEWTTREGVLNEEFEKRMAKIDENTAIESAKVDEAYLSSLAKLATNQADANTLLEGFLAQRAAINAKYADLIASTDESIANRAKEMRDKELADLTANTEAKLGLLVTNKDAITALEQKKEDDLAQIQKDANFKKLEEEKLANEKKRKEKFEQDKKIWEAQKKALDAQHKLDVQNFKFQKAMAVVQIGISTAVLAASLGAKTLGVGIIAGLAMGGALLAMAKLLDPPAAPEYPAEPDFANYEIGTDNTSVDARKSKRVDNKGGYNAVLHPEEAVFSKKDMAAMTKANNGIRPTRADVIDVFKSHKNIMYNLDTSPTIAPYVLNGMIKDMGLREELINVKKEIVGMRQEFMKPSVSVNLDKRGMNVYEQKRSHTVKKMSSRYRIKI